MTIGHPSSTSFRLRRKSSVLRIAVSRSVGLRRRSPTLDELIRRADLPEAGPVATLTMVADRGINAGHVFTLRIEIEGGRLSDAVDESLGEWRALY